MAILTVRNVPDEVHRAPAPARGQPWPQYRGRSARDPEHAVKAEQRPRLGDLLAELGRKAGLRNEDFAVLEDTRDRKPAKPMKIA